MSNDPELFELCKKVYELTGWNKTGKVWYSNGGKVHNLDSVHVDGEVFDKPANVPLYNSDYLLDKLPKEIKLDGYHYVGDHVVNTFSLQVDVPGEGYGWCFYYSNGEENYHLDNKSDADTPLKALLKLTLALHEAGEL